MPPGERLFLDWLSRTAKPNEALDVPLGDDGAVWRLPSGEELVVAADAIAEGAHFESEDDPRLVGRKALAVNLSDLAAMGARPLFALATCALPRGFADSLPRQLTEGLREIGEECGCPLIGGDTISHDGGVVLSVTVIGVPLPGGPVTRGGGSVGDLIAVTGALGGSRDGRHLSFKPRLEEASSLLAAGPPTAMLDVSDGLLVDLHRLADASGVGFALRGDDVPVHPDAVSNRDDPLQSALSEGEDFELLFTAPGSVMANMLSQSDGRTPLMVIGELTQHGRRVLRVGEIETEAPRAGHEHG